MKKFLFHIFVLAASTALLTKDQAPSLKPESLHQLQKILTDASAHIASEKRHNADIQKGGQSPRQLMQRYWRRMEGEDGGTVIADPFMFIDTVSCISDPYNPLENTDSIASLMAYLQSILDLTDSSLTHVNVTVLDLQDSACFVKELLYLVNLYIAQLPPPAPINNAPNNTGVITPANSPQLFQCSCVPIQEALGSRRAQSQLRRHLVVGPRFAMPQGRRAVVKYRTSVSPYPGNRVAHQRLIRKQFVRRGHLVNPQGTGVRLAGQQYVIRGLVRHGQKKYGYRRYLDGTTVATNSTVSTNQNNYVGDVANYKTVPNLIVIIEGLATIYNTIYSNVPTEEDKAKQDSWDKLANGIQTYAKIRNFAVALLVNNEKVVGDLQYVKKNINTLSFNLEETLSFYDFKDRYNRLKLKSLSLTPIFFEKEKLLESDAGSFSANVRGVGVSIDYLLYVNDYLIKQTQFLREKTDPGTPDSIYYIQTVDNTILLIPSLINAKKDVTAALESIKSSLYSIRDIRMKLDATLIDMEKIVDGTYVGVQVVAGQSSASRASFTLVLFMLGLLL